MSGPVRVARPLLPLQPLARAKGIEAPAADVTATTAGWVRIAARNDADLDIRDMPGKQENIWWFQNVSKIFSFSSVLPIFGCFE